jgi:hypothetical protein
MKKEDKHEKLFHYTTQEGLVGILQEKKLWATKIQYLNDASELTRPLELGIDMIDTILQSVGSKKKTKEIWLERRRELGSWKGVNLCVASFCVDGDLLSQWRGYGAYGTAYSIGFRTEKLEEIVSHSGFQLRPCSYYDEYGYKQRVQNFFIAYESKSQEPKEDAIRCVVDFIKNVATMKLRCFEEEREWRIVSSEPLLYSDSNFMFRTEKSMIIPYYAIPLKDLSSVAEIIIGPCKHPDLVQRTVLGLCVKHGLKNIHLENIKISSIPYRVF